MAKCAEVINVSREWLLNGDNPPPWAAHDDAIGDTCRPPRIGALQEATGPARGTTESTAMIEALHSLRVSQDQTTEVLTELVRKCRALDEALASLKRLEDLGPAPGDVGRARRGAG